MRIRRLGDPALKEAGQQIKEIDSSVSDLVRLLEQMMDEANGIGLAATQVGVLRQIFVYRLDDEVKAVINPQIVNVGDETETDEEGCLSLPHGLHIPVERATKMVIKATGLDGKTEELEAEGLLARIFQHEIDHLNGLLIIDRASREDRREAFKQIKDGIIATSGQRSGRAL